MGQFGTTESNTQYDLSANTLMLQVNWNYTKRGKFTFNTSWVDSQAGFRSLTTTASADAPMDLFPGGELPGPGEDPGSPLHFADYDLSHINEYSDLSFTEIRASTGIRHQLTRFMDIYGNVAIYDLSDNDPYRQDASGRVELYTAGLYWTF